MNTSGCHACAKEMFQQLILRAYKLSLDCSILVFALTGYEKRFELKETIKYIEYLVIKSGQLF